MFNRQTHPSVRFKSSCVPFLNNLVLVLVTKARALSNQSPLKSSQPRDRVSESETERQRIVSDETTCFKYLKAITLRIPCSYRRIWKVEVFKLKVQTRAAGFAVLKRDSQRTLNFFFLVQCLLLRKNWKFPAENFHLRAREGAEDYCRFEGENKPPSAYGHVQAPVTPELSLHVTLSLLPTTFATPLKPPSRIFEVVAFENDFRMKSLMIQGVLI